MMCFQKKYLFENPLEFLGSFLYPLKFLQTKDTFTVMFIPKLHKIVYNISHKLQCLEPRPLNIFNFFLINSEKFSIVVIQPLEIPLAISLNPKLPHTAYFL